MATLSGKDGKVVVGGTPLAEITAWTLVTSSRNPSYASSDTGGWKTRLAGVKDGRGMLRGKLDTASPITSQLDEGDAATLLLHLNGTLSYQVPAIIDELRLEIDIDTGDVIGWAAEFSVTGAVTKPSYS